MPNLEECDSQSRLGRAFRRGDEEGRALLFGYLPAGYPDPEIFKESVQGAFVAGLGALEVGLPSEAPGLDGPLIQKAAHLALSQVKTIDDALALAADSRSSGADPLIALAYRHVVDSQGVGALLDLLQAHEIDGILLPEHSMKEQLEIGLLAAKRGIEPVLFLHLQEDLSALAETELGCPIIYLQSSAMSTGGPFDEEKAAERLGELAEAMGTKPYRVAVGFGIRGPQEASFVVEHGADAAIIGSGLVREIEAGPESVRELVSKTLPSLRRSAD